MVYQSFGHSLVDGREFTVFPHFQLSLPTLVFYIVDGFQDLLDALEVSHAAYYVLLQVLLLFIKIDLMIAIKLYHFNLSLPIPDKLLQ